MNIKKIIYGLGGLLTGLLLEFFQDRQMSIEVEEQVQKALEERGLTDERRDPEVDNLLSGSSDSEKHTG